MNPRQRKDLARIAESILKSRKIIDTQRRHTKQLRALAAKIRKESRA